MSGVDLPDGTKIRKGAADAIEQYVTAQGGKIPADLHEQVDEVSALGGTPLVVCENNQHSGCHLSEGYRKARHGGAL